MKRFFVILLTIEAIIISILAVMYHQLKDSYMQQCEIVSKYERNTFVVEDENCILWNISEDSAVTKLPPPLWHGDVKIIDDGSWTPPPYERYLSKIKGTHDTLTIHPYRWYNPFSNRTKIEIIFENVDGRWIATSCLEYDPKEVEF